MLKNFNTYSKNSTVYEGKNDHEIFGTFLLKTEFPLKKTLEKGNNFLKPVAQLRFSPTNGKNIIIKDVICDAFLQQILTRPKEYDVIATMNLNGDYVSDALAACVGGIGIARR